MIDAIIHPEARAEIDSEMGRYELVRPGLGLEFEAEVGRIILLIRENPNIGANYSRQGIRYFAMRRFPHVLFYEQSEFHVQSLAVAHGRRRPGY